ncbi:FecR family protein [Gelidibacter japonicus]|uniref:FecR family protein n=1 Tax=Gelidibacter japonicus TaxID=1962232 RepID=UPI003A8CBFD2
MPIFNKIYKLSKKLSNAILENKSLHDVETPVDWSEDVKKQVLDGFSDHEIKANLELLDNIDTKSGWEQIEHRISADKSKHQKRLSILSFYKVAAVMVLFITIGYIIFNDATHNTDIVIKPTTIEAGTDKAILTLENGTDVILEKGKSFNNGTVHSNGEQLEYSRTNTSSKPVFNILTIPRGGQYKVVLPDSTVVWLNADTKIKYPLNYVVGEPRQVELVYGEAYFKVSPSTKNQGSVFKVLAQMQEVEVLGTEFNLKAYSDENQIYTTLVEGSVNIAVAENKQRLRPGEQSILHTNTKLMTKQTVNVDYDVAWVRGYFNFKNKPLREIMKVLSRWYDVDITFETDKLENIQFSGLLNRRQNIEDILDGIKNTKFINAYEIDNKKIIIK